MLLPKLERSQTPYESDSGTRLRSLLNVVKERVSIGVVYSGNPDAEGTVVCRTTNVRSWKSYKAVAEDIAQALRSSGFKIVDIVEEGQEFRNALSGRRFDLFWLNTSGVQDRAPAAHASSILESLGYPYVGHNPLQSGLLDDKILLKQWLRGVGIPTAPFIVRGGCYARQVNAADPDLIREFGSGDMGPYLLKPAHGRGSVDVQLIDSLPTLNKNIEALLQKTHDRVIIEPFLPGQEYCVWASRGMAIENAVPTSMRVFNVFGHVERVIPERERIYLKREIDSRVIDPCKPLVASDTTLKADLSALAKNIYAGLALSVPVRIDARRNEGGRLSILEVNPKPDLKRPNPGISGLLSSALDDLSTSYEDFIVKILADWLDFQLRFSPSSVNMLAPLFERYS